MKKYMKVYYIKNKDKFIGYVKKYQTSEKGKEKIKKYRKEYNKRPEVKEKTLMRDKERYYKNNQNKKYRRINKQIRLCIKIYLRDGKLNLKQNTDEKYKILYGIDLNEIINYLKPFPKNLNGYEIDHIIPIKNFNLDNREETSKAYSKNNLRLIPSIQNKIKGSKFSS